MGQFGLNFNRAGITAADTGLSAGRRVGWANPIPMYNVNAPWYRYITPRFDIDAGVVTEGRTTAQIMATKAHEGQHIADILNHPQITYLAGKETYFPGAGFSRYWLEYRGYCAGGTLQNLATPLQSFRPKYLNFFWRDVSISAGLGLGAGYGTYYNYFINQ
jgi:hypothetical protein